MKTVAVTNLLMMMLCCGSGSGRIRNSLPDPDRYQFQAHVFLYFFLENYNMLFKIQLENPDTSIAAYEKGKLALL
jgi:hypothetical protein